MVWWTDELGQAGTTKLRPADRQISWTPELQLVRAILRADWSANEIHCFDPALFRGLDWSQVANLAWRHKIRPMMTAALRSAHWPGTPNEIRAGLEADEQRCNRKAMLQLQWLADLSTAAAQKGVRVVALKGVALSLHLYANPFIRESFDLDLLVAADDRAAFDTILRDCGFAQQPAHLPLSVRQTAILERFDHHQRFMHPGDGTVIEHHARLHSNPHLIGTDFEALWAARCFVPLAGGSIAILGGEDLVHHLGIHAAYHGWERWKWLADLITLFRRASDSDLQRQRQRAAQAGNGDLYDSWLLLAQAVSGEALPHAALDQAAANRYAQSLAARSLRHSTRDLTPDILFSRKNVRRAFGYKLRLRRRPRYVAHELAGLLHRSEDWYRLRLPDRFIWFYYLMWPAGYLGRRLKALFSRSERKELKA